MITVQESIDIAVPVTAAYNQWTQFESFPEFMHGVESVTQTSKTTNHWVTRIGGKQHEFDAVITEQHADERVAWKSVDGKSHAGVVTFHRLDHESCRVTVQLDWDPETFMEKVGSALGLDDRQVKSDLRRFKDFIEGRGSETGSWRGDVAAPGAMAGGLDSPAAGTQGSGAAESPLSAPGSASSSMQNSADQDLNKQNPAVEDPDSGEARSAG
ncbi:SRPBCC family protein [Arthrobacter sp. H14-L1]|uniref:SRPBCC family protein n=1 Tax=Arthrobacter sp. H14-L1 TaxID=2996697 RepID=UPI002D1E44B8|nr:SRPBCC family protein [Arthrobacter sp. H14-L1]